MKHLLAVSHCILNHAAKVQQNEEELAQEYELRSRLLVAALEKDVQLLQLPCPEFIIYGSHRWGHVKQQFEHPFYKEQCRKLLEPILLQLQEYSNNRDLFDVLGVVSVEGSPNCGYHLTCSADWMGEIGTDEQRIAELIDSLEMIEDKGTYMEVLEQELIERSLYIPIITMEEALEVINQL